MTEAENGKRQVHARTLDSQGSGLGASASTSTGANTKTPTSVGQGMGPSRQPGPTPGRRWRSDTPPTPHHIVSEPGTPPKPEPPSVATPSRTSSATLTTQASPGPSRSIMGPVIKPARQTQNASGSTSTGGNPRKPSCVPSFMWGFVRRVTDLIFVPGWVERGRCRPYSRLRHRQCPIRRYVLSWRYRRCKNCRRRPLRQRTNDRCVISRKRSRHVSKRLIS